MKTILDEVYSLFLDKVIYENEGELKIFVIEGIKSNKLENIEILDDKEIRDTYSIDIQEESKKFLIEFEYAIFFQVLDESFTGLEEIEGVDIISFIQKVKNSNYLQYIKQNHGWFEQIVGEGIHFRIMTLTEIIDVIACEEPKIIEIK